LRVSRSPFIPAALKQKAFDLRQARDHGLTKDHLRAACWRRIGHELYAWHEAASEPLLHLFALQRVLPDDAVFSGRTAAWLHGLDLMPSPFDVTFSPTSGITRRAGMSVHRASLSPLEIVIRRGVRATAALRTLADLCRRVDVVEGVVALDQALHRRLVSKRALAEWTNAHRGLPGVARLRRALELSEPATESVMETRLRVLLVLAGLPRPHAQTVLTDGGGAFLGRVDLYYPEQRLAIEYDGAGHRERLASDNQRQNRLLDAGYRLLRFTATDVLSNPGSVATLVRRGLTPKK
jgi:very-short-patch-repair endonuclease